MPNWCYNRITVYGDSDTTDKIKEVEEIFKSKTPFNEIYPMPDFKTIPNENGELPVLEQHKNPDGSIMWETYNFPDGTNDSRWYDWNLANWDTKWDINGSVEVDQYDSEQVEINFSTAWSPPEAICRKLRDMFPDVGFSWFYDEPGMEFAGYL